MVCIPQGFGAVQKSVYQDAGLEQLRKRTEAWALGFAGAVVLLGYPDLGRRLQVGPLGRNVRAAFVRQDQQEVQAAVAMRPSQKLEGLTLERMVWSDDGDRLRKTFEVGSVSWCPSITSIMKNWLGCWS